MAVNALDIVTRSSEMTWCLTSDVSQRQYLVLVRFVEVIVRTLISVGTIVAEEVDIAHFYLLDPFDFAFIILN